MIANTDEFTKRNLAKVGYEANPLETGELSDYVVQGVPMTALTLGAVEAIGASKKDGERAKNMFALGLLSWMYGRPIEPSETFIREKFARKPDVAEANVLALQGGLELRRDHRGVRAPSTRWRRRSCPPASTARSPATPRWPTGSSRRASSPTFQVVLGSYPITPASDILHELSKHKNFNVHDLPGRGRDRRHRCRARRLLRWRAGRDEHVGSGCLAEVRSASASR